jgi:hypothetical protein
MTPWTWISYGIIVSKDLPPLILALEKTIEKESDVEDSRAP